MAFDYSKINPEVLKKAAVICEKPSHMWTDSEAKIMAITIEALKITLKHRKPTEHTK